MSDFRINWSGTSQMGQNMRRYKRLVLHAIKQVANYWAAVFENYAKSEAPWTDRTGNARQNLHTFIEELSGDTVRLYLSHGMDYGIYLETRYAGRYEIIMPTIRRHLPQIRQMLQGIFR